MSNYDDEDEKENENKTVKELLNQIPLNTLNDFYDIESSLFKKRIDKLNLKFFWETESLISQKEIPKPFNKLFLILFKEINLYTEEIERLNLIIRDKNKNEKYFKEKLYEFNKKEKDSLLTKQMLKNYQKQNKQLEKRLKEKEQNEDKLRFEIEKLKQKSNPMISSIKTKSNKRNCHSIDNIDESSKTAISVKKKIKKRNPLNNSMIIANNKTYNTFTIENKIDMGINEDIVSQCINHYNDELEQLDQIERYLEKHKRDINDLVIKNNFANLKTTLKNIPR